jgi:hypothetical protein
MTRQERLERDQGRARERAVPQSVRDKIDALVGFEVRLTRELETFGGGSYLEGMVFQTFERYEDKLVVRLAPTREKKRSGKPKVPTTFIMLRLEWVEPTGRKNGQKEDEDEDVDDPGDGEEDEDGREGDALEA